MIIGSVIVITGAKSNYENNIVLFWKHNKQIFIYFVKRLWKDL
jgi:hypothetical protein